MKNIEKFKKMNADKIIIIALIIFSYITINDKLDNILIQIQKYEEKASWEVGERVTLRDGCPAIMITP